MQFHVIGLTHDQKIFWGVVFLVSVYVVNNLCMRKFAPDNHLRNNSVLMPAIVFDIANTCSAQARRIDSACNFPLSPLSA